MAPAAQEASYCCPNTAEEAFQSFIPGYYADTVENASV